MNFLNKHDFIDLYIKIHQRGLAYVLSKFRFSRSERVRATFDDPDLETANWWDIPIVHERWNELITGDCSLSYEEYVVKKYLRASSTPYQMLSVGCGTGGREIRFGGFDEIKKLEGIDVAAKLIEEAHRAAREKGISHKLKFHVADYRTIKIPNESFDIILFHSSLHHFSNIEEIISKTKDILRPGGLLIVNEFVGPNRLQWRSWQVARINEILPKIPVDFRKIYKTNLVKSRVARPGLLRMLLNDPSEAAESEKILPCLQSNFRLVERKDYGGSILMPLLKDISHHFIAPDPHAGKVLEWLFREEDNYLIRHPSDFVFAIFAK